MDARLHYSEDMPAEGDVRFTFLMQVGLILGTLTAYPAMRYLVNRRRDGHRSAGPGQAAPAHPSSP